MGKAVIDYLSKLTDSGNLPSMGHIAGQSVLSALLALYASDPEHNGPVKDIDVFHTFHDRMLEYGGLDGVDKTAMDAAMASDKEYEHIFENKLNIRSVTNSGILNIIELIPSKILDNDLSERNSLRRLDLLLSEFDLSPVQVGVDLSTGMMRWTTGFEDFVNGAPARACHINMAERTWMRMLRKEEQMPWSKWDQDQILSACQLAQITTALATRRNDELSSSNFSIYAMGSNSHSTSVSPPKKEKFEKFNHLINDWRQQCEHEFDALQRHSKESNPSFSGLVPLWNWEMNNPSWDTIDYVDFRRKGGLLKLNENDSLITDAIFNASIMMRSDFSCESFFKNGKIKDNFQFLASTVKEEHLIGYLIKNSTLLLEDGPPGKQEKNHRLLQISLFEHHYDLAFELLNAGFSPNYKGGLDDTAYLTALKDFNAPETLLQKMRDCGADIRLRHGNHSTVAHEIITHTPENKMMSVVQSHPIDHWKVLNEAGFFPGQDNMSHSWAAPSRLEAIKNFHKLIEVKSRPDLTLVNKLKEALKKKDVHEVSQLLQDGVNPNSFIDHRTPALIDPAYRNSAPIVELLIQHGADVNKADSEGTTALIVAIRNGNTEVVECLLKNGAKTELADKKGLTPLYFAVTQSKIKEVALLIDNGANVNYFEKFSGRTLLEMSMYSFSPNISSMIVRKIDKEEGKRLIPQIIKKAEFLKSNVNCIAVLQSEMAKYVIDDMMAFFEPKPCATSGALAPS